MCLPLSKREEIISVAAQNCVYNFVQGGELLSVAVYWGHKLCVSKRGELLSVVV